MRRWSRAHSAQGVTADATHAVLGETVPRALAYVALTRGREASNAYLYQGAAEHEYPESPTEAGHVTLRGSSEHAARLLRGIVANGASPTTAHDLAATDANQALPGSVRGAIDQRATRLRDRAREYVRWHTAVALDSTARDIHTDAIKLDRSDEYGLEL